MKRRIGFFDHMARIQTSIVELFWEDDTSKWNLLYENLVDH